MFYSDNPKIAFVAIPKTGTRAIYDVLKKHFGGRLHKEHIRIIPEKFKQHFSFIVVRNPYDRACSMWWSTCKRGQDRHGFIAEMKKHGWENTLNGFMKVVQNSKGKGFRISHPMNDFFINNKIDVKLRFEHLEEDFNKLPFVKKKISLPVLNPTKAKTGANPVVRPRWETLVDEETINTINEVYVADFKATGYEMITNYTEWCKEQDDE